ncbi:MAG: type II toxin-antitoxin system prevent-host-death family antitoxin [Vicinamibacterales bacterium]
MTVKIADLKNNLSRHLAHVREGGELTVLDRNTPVARIVPFTPRQAVRDGRGRSTASDSGRESAARIEELQRLGILGGGDADGFGEWVRRQAPARLPKASASALDLLLRARRESTR